MKISRNVSLLSIVSALVVLSSFSGCNGSGGFGGAGGGGSADRDEDAGESEDETGDVPEEVSGAFLTCAFMDSRNTVMARVERDTEDDLGIACGIFKPESGEVKIAAISHLTMRTRILTGEDDYKTLKHTRLRAGSHLHVVAQVPIKYLAGTLQIDVKAENGRWVAFRKSIPTIQSFDAREGFRIDEDMEQQGISLAGDGSARIVTTGTSSGGIDWFREIVAPVLIGVYGATAGQQASNDNGTQVLQGKKNNSNSGSYNGYNENPYQYDQVTYNYSKNNGGKSNGTKPGAGPTNPGPSTPTPGPTNPDPSTPTPGPTNPGPEPGSTPTPGPTNPGPEPGPAPSNPSPSGPAPGPAPGPTP